MTPNHTSNFDGLYIIKGLSQKFEFIAIAKDELKTNKFSNGFINGSESVYLDPKDIRSSVNSMNMAGKIAVNKSRGVVIFPEGTRSLDGNLLPFKAGSYKMAQKYFIPIVPVTILNTMAARQ
ncbi:MAG: hypothetical protein DRP42_02140 [Tenericutes bacterium]|nr:MAG: hypothetical protein DRP42_02140 [Mycoplasmatota bacterium]